MGKRGPEPKPEERQVRIELFVSPECEERLEQMAPNTGRGRKPKGVPVKGRVVCAALTLAERHPEEFKALLDQTSAPDA